MAEFDRPTVAARAGTAAVIDEGLRSYMLKVYNYMGIGLVVTGLVAFLATRGHDARLAFGQVTRLSWQPGLELQPAISPDGRFVAYGAGTHDLTREGIGTRFAAVAVRTLFDPGNPRDLTQVHALQDAIIASVRAAIGGAGAHGDNPLRVGHLLVQ